MARGPKQATKTQDQDVQVEQPTETDVQVTEEPAAEEQPTNTDDQDGENEAPADAGQASEKDDQDNGTEQPTKTAKTGQPTKADRVRAFEVAFQGHLTRPATDPESDDQDTEEPVDDAPVTESDVWNALREVGPPASRTAALNAMAISVANAALFATGGGQPNLNLAGASNDLRSKLDARSSAPATEQGPDPATVLDARLAAIGRLAGQALKWADDHQVSTDDLDAGLVRAARLLEGRATRSWTDDQDPWAVGFTTKSPNLDRVPGSKSRSRGGNGGGANKRPSDALDAIPSGTTVQFDYKGRTFKGQVTTGDGGKHVTSWTDDQGQAVVGSPTKTATAAIESHREAPERVSVNGWETWTDEHGTTLGDLYDELTAN